MFQITIQDILEASGGTLLSGDLMTGVSGLCIDSRKVKDGDLFVPLIGENVDAHRFMPDVLKTGISSLTSEHEKAPEGAKGALIRVPDTKTALQDIGRYLRKRFSFPFLGITGSVGKTTTRELTACALSAKYHVFRTPGNHNGQIGLPLALAEISPEDEFAVLEMGISIPGEMPVLADIARPEACIITNIGTSHLENLGSREGILREKLHIADKISAGGPLFVNGDNDLLNTLIPPPGARPFLCGIGEHNECRAEDLHTEGIFPAFTYVHGNVRVPVTLSVPGEHNAGNAVLAMAAAEYYGCDLKASAEKIRAFNGFKHRQQFFDEKGITIIDDAYNASPDSMRASLKVLMNLPVQRRIAVLGDMKELGPEEVRLHRELGSSLAGSPLDILICYGELAKEIAKGCFSVKKGNTRVQIEAFDKEEKQEMITFLRNTLKEGDAVLFKGSNSMKLWEAAEGLMNSKG